MRPSSPAPGPVYVWSLRVRLFHWALATSVAGAWLLSEDLRLLHQYAGYAAVALVAGRILLGVFGKGHERFADFVRGPRATLAYLRDIPLRRERRHLGHNPAGGTMIVALLCAIAAIGLTGWLMTTDIFWGDERVEAIHKLTANGLVFLVVLHVSGVLVSSLSHRENLVRAMITGWKRPNEDHEPKN
jgi:cytochrome b